MEKLNFSECTLAKMEKIFKLAPVPENQLLSEWIATDIELTDFDKESVRRLYTLLQENVAHWNEYDLSLHFIGPMFSYIHFTKRMRFNLFAQRTIEADINNIKLMGRVDELIASGYREPELPFFAFSEYKKETNPEGDPAGQVLGAMLVAQYLNKQEGAYFPIFGCYIIGRNWFFVVLEGHKYTISDAFRSTNYNDALQILRILFQLKAYCMERTAHIVVEN
ncbi:MAG: hypothetical protein RI894_326 [Bacteroidota bacterium]|jgi:hypothetical protein